MPPRKTNPKQSTGSSIVAATSIPLSRGKKMLFWGAMLFLGTVAGLAIAEVAVRVFDLKPESFHRKALLVTEEDPSVTYFCYSSNPNAEFQPVPDVTRGNWQLYTFPATSDPVPITNLRNTPWCVQEQRSSQDLRDRVFPLEAPKGVVRVAMVGDSFVRGEGVAAEFTLPKQLEALLGTNRHEIINIGYSGLATEHEVLAVKTLAVQTFHSSRAILVFIPNDIHLTDELMHRQKYINDLINVREDLLANNGHRTWYESSQLVRYFVAVMKMRQVGRETAQWYLDSYDPVYNADGLQRLTKDFKTLASLPTCRVVVVLYPLMYDLENGYPLRPIHERVKKLVEEAGLPVLDLAPVFIGADTRSLQVHPCDHHPNRRAHARAARAIKEWLERDVPGFLND